MAELTGAANMEPLIQAACCQLEHAGIETVVISSGNCQPSQLNAWDILARQDCDGYIVHSDTLSNDQLARLKSLRKNTILANIDHTLAGKLAASVICKLGHTNIAMVAGPLNRFSVQRRSHGFLEQLKLSAASTARIKNVHIDEISFQTGRQSMHQLLDSDSPPTIVFYQHEIMAAGARQACKENRVHVPEDISLLTCSESALSGLYKSTICMVRQPLQAIGRFAANRILSLLDLESQMNYSSTTAWPSPYIEFHNSLKERNPATLQAQPAVKQISDREKECLQWAAKGKTSWEISQILGVTESTIIYHLRNATRKLNAANRLHAVTKALKASIIEF